MVQPCVSDDARLHPSDGNEFARSRSAGERLAVENAELRRRLAEAEANRTEESEANFHTFFETIDDLIVVAAPDGRIHFTNSALERRLGHTPEDLRTIGVLDLHPRDRQQQAMEIFGAMLRGERASCPLPLAAKNGTLVPVETRVWQGRWNGEPCIFGICKDLSARRRPNSVSNGSFTATRRPWRYPPSPSACSWMSTRPS